MAAEVNVVVNAIDNFSTVLGNFGNIVTGIKSAIDLVSDAFNAASDAISPFVESASDSEVAISAFDSVLRSTSTGAGLFEETIGRLSNASLLDLHEQLATAKDRLGEMREEFGNVRTYTEAETLAITVQQEKIASLTAQIERGTNGLTVLRDTTQLTRDQMLELASAIQRVTQYSDEEVLAAESMMLRFENVNSTIFPDAIRLATDLAQSLGIDLTTAARQIGMALDDPEQGIGRLNTSFRIFNETQMETIKNMAANGDLAGAQALIMQALTEKVGGAAEAYGNTFAGSLAIATNKLDDFRELIGGPIIYLLGQLLDKVMEFADTNPVIQGVIRFFTEFNELLANPEVPFLSALGVALLHLSDSLPFLQDLGGVLLALQGNLNTGMDPFTALALGLETLADKWEGTAAGGIVERLTEFLNTAQSDGFGAAFGDLFDDAWTWVTQQLPQKVQNFIDGLANQLTLANTSGLSYSLGQIIGDAFEVALRGLNTTVAAIDWQPFGTAMRTAILEMWQGLTEDGTLGAELITMIVGPAWAQPGGHDPVLDWFKMIGQEAWHGFIDGIGAYPGMLDQWAWDHIVLPIRRILGISSPSTVFFEIGLNMVQGLVLGFTSAIGSFLGMIQNFVNSILNFLSPVFDFLGIDLNLGGTGGTTGGIPGDTTHPRDPGTGTTTGGMLGGVINNFYGPVYVGTMEELYCPSPHPLMTASSQSLLTSTIG